MRGSLLSLLLLLLVGCGRVELYSNLDESEINEMAAILQRASVPAEKIPGTENSWSLKVEPGRFSDAVELLGKHGLPRDHFVGIAKSFQKSGLVSSPTEERIRFMHAISQELSETLSHIDGVLTARVHVVIPENNPFVETIRPSSAAVFIKHRADADVESSIPQIKNLVVNSIEGLSYEKVTVALFPSHEFLPSGS